MVSTIKDVYKKIFFRGDDAKYAEMIFSSFGVATHAVANWSYSRPWFSKIYIYPMAAIAGYAIGAWVQTLNHKRIVYKEHAIWDFVNSHPEHFPDIKPKKYKDVLDDWHPIR